MKKLKIFMVMYFVVSKSLGQTDSVKVLANDYNRFAVGSNLVGGYEDQQQQVMMTFNYSFNIKNNLYGGIMYSLFTTFKNENSTQSYFPVQKGQQLYSSLYYNTRVFDNFGFIFGHQYLLTKSPHRVKFYFESNARFYGYKQSKDSVFVTNKRFHDLVIKEGISIKVKFLKYFYYYHNVSIGPIVSFEKSLSDNKTRMKTSFDFMPFYLGLGCNF